MSELKFPCPSCNQKISCDDGYAGQQIQCPVCQKPLTVPKAAAAAPVAAAAPAASAIGSGAVGASGVAVTVPGSVKLSISGSHSAPPPPPPAEAPSAIGSGPKGAGGTPVGVPAPGKLSVSGAHGPGGASPTHTAATGSSLAGRTSETKQNRTTSGQAMGSLFLAAFLGMIFQIPVGILFKGSYYAAAYACAAGAVGSIIAIVCAHSARAEIKRNSALRGAGFAIAAMVIGYLWLSLQILGCGGSVWVGHMAQQAEEEKIAQEKRLAEDKAQKEAAAAAAAGVQPGEPIPAWSLDLSKMPFPNRPASGTIHGMTFKVDSAKIMTNSPVLNLRQGNGSLPDLQFSVFLPVAGAVVAGRTFNVTSDQTPSKPQKVIMAWLENGSKIATQTFTNGYAMKLEFAQGNGTTISAKILLSVPDDAQSYVAGNLNVQLVSPPPPQQMTQQQGQPAQQMMGGGQRGGGGRRGR